VHEVEIDCHHWPLTERPDDVRRAIESWCNDLADVSPASEHPRFARVAQHHHPANQR
jgi:hypothetical protein